MLGNREIVEGAVSAINLHDAARVITFWAPDGVERFPDKTCHGAAEVAAYFQHVFDALPDVNVEPHTIVADGETVFLRSDITGTHTGAPFNGINATGKRIDIPAIDQFTIRDGLIVHNFVVFDQMEMGRQLGVLPPDGSPAHKGMLGAVNAVNAARGMLAARVHIGRRR